MLLPELFPGAERISAPGSPTPGASVGAAPAGDGEESTFAELLAAATDAVAPESIAAWAALDTALPSFVPDVADAARDVTIGDLDAAPLVEEAESDVAAAAPLTPIIVLVPLDVAAAISTASGEGASPGTYMPVSAEDRDAAAPLAARERLPLASGEVAATWRTRGSALATSPGARLEVSEARPGADAPAIERPQAEARPPIESSAPPSPEMVAPPLTMRREQGVPDGLQASAQVMREQRPPQTAPLSVPVQAPSGPSSGADAAAEAPHVPDVASVVDAPSPGSRSQTTVRDDETRQASAAALRELTAAVGRIAPANPPPQDDGGSSNRDARQPSPGTEIAYRPRAAVAAPATTALVVSPTETLAGPTVQAPASDAPVTPAQTAENVARLVESVRVQWRQGVPEATVKLNPEHLGEVTISVRVERGQVAAVVHAETAAVQQWLEAHEEKVRSGLADQGLTLERFVVQRDRQQSRRDGRQAPPQRYRAPEASGQRFEITV